MKPGEMRRLLEEVKRDIATTPRAEMVRQLVEAGWVSDPSGEVWIPPKGTVPYRPYQRYSGWKRMQELQKEKE